MAERDDDAHRRSGALYQLSKLYLALKQPQNALDASRQAYRFAELAGSTPGMVKARMAESAALEMLADPARELAAMEEALALARKSRSQVGESLALINLADIRLRRRQFNDALELSRQSLALATEYNDMAADRDQQGEHRIRAVRARTRGRRQAVRGRGARRIRAHGRDRRNRRRCSTSTASISSAQGTTGPRWRSSIGRKLTRTWPPPRTSGRCSSCRRNTSRKGAGAKSNCSTARTRSTRRSSKTRGCGSVSVGCSPRSS